MWAGGRRPYSSWAGVAEGGPTAASAGGSEAGLPEASEASLAPSVRVSWFWAGGGFLAVSAGLFAAAASVPPCASSFAGVFLSAALGVSGLGADRRGGALGVPVALATGLAGEPSPRSTRGATLGGAPEGAGGALALGRLGCGAGPGLAAVTGAAVAVLEVRVVLSLAGLLWVGEKG